MTFELIDETRILIVLAEDDMDFLNLNYDTMSFKDPHSRKILKKLLTLAKTKTGIPSFDHRVIIDALPYNTGCLLVLTLAPKNDKPRRYKIKKPFFETAFCFEETEDMLCATEALYKNGYLLTGSCILSFKSKYYFIIGNQKEIPLKAKHILNEYSLKKTTDKKEIFRIKECGKLIAKKHPILNIGSAMCR